MSTPVRVRYVDSVKILIHRVMAQHGPGVMCPECPALCRHCGNVGPQGEDHTCPCPYSDADCPVHPANVLPPEVGD